ncbi:DUF3299 domain-containing protein [Thalassotalea sp. Y01]|uniref:DUF3299 domain-containing protein n=1 Tax=Thalassotalea sp. Y01 TaxID=2729613 RepID=UPI00145CB22B|nr:DUF3299 domain-containing protein [Thalassotalea sp. Y01]NMP16012.1 DUF3299 domain-containing protein [Thalassotalea sp. Y01]
MLKFLPLIIFFLVLINSAFASETIEWDQLKPPPPKSDIVLPNLTDSQLRKIQEIFWLTHSKESEISQKIEKIKLELKKEGVDADEVFRIREEYIAHKKSEAETVNHDIDGKVVRMSGFLIPTKFKENIIVSEFLLVPSVGASIHMPLPQPNQIVRVSFPKGFTVKTLRQPVLVEGIINSNLHSDNLHIIDGNKLVTMGYSLRAVHVSDL